ncbi:DUF397 domain-containing protein [Spirillospora sp. NPDC127200]
MNQWRKSSRSGGLNDDACVEVAGLVKWRKSRHSGGGNDDACVEVAHLTDVVGVRDSKDPDGPRLNVSRDAFDDLLARVRGGELDW